MEDSSIEKDDISRLTDRFPRETVDLVFHVADKAFQIALENFISKKKECETKMEKTAKNIIDLKAVLKEFAKRTSENLDDIFKGSQFLIDQKSLIPKEIVNFSISKIEKLINKTVVKLTISLNEEVIKRDALTTIIKDHKSSKLQNSVKIAKKNLKII
jgi:hypothetical protein